jgi:catechol 2,3-dioxygenase-like lactoylglutathione lyase family enzyme
VPQEDAVTHDPTGRLAPILVVTDVERTVDVCTTVLGLERLRYFDGNDEYVVLGRGDAQIHLLKGRSANPNNRSSAHGADVFLWVDDLDGIITAARAAGLPITRGPERYDSTPMATTEVVIEDHDGYWFCCAVAHPE